MVSLLCGGGGEKRKELRGIQGDRNEWTND